MYKDPYNKFGQLASERFRAARLVIDTGIHSMGWTREQAQEYLRAHAPTQAIEEVDRYISWPAQALSYKMGQLKIVELRKQAETRMGAKFDVRDFHDALLRDGSLPLELLEEQVGEIYCDRKVRRLRRSEVRLQRQKLRTTKNNKEHEGRPRCRLRTIALRLLRILTRLRNFRVLCSN